MTDPAEQECLIVFARAPVLGACKKRLAVSIGDAAALAAHVELATSALQRVQAFPGRKVLCVTEKDAEVEAWARTFAFQLEVQATGDLGVRMQTAMMAALQNGAQRVVLMGTDCPDIGLQYVLGAMAELDTNDLVLGPAEDGGYGLIGLKTMHRALFASISWGSNKVLEQTQSAAQQLSLNTSLQATIWDVDDVNDWERYLAGVAD